MRFRLLLIAMLLVAPLSVANATPFSLRGMKKANEIWLNSGSGSNFRMFDGWQCSEFVEGVKLTGNRNPKQKIFHLEYNGSENGYFAIFKKNGKLKKWGEYQFSRNSNSLKFRKLKKRLFAGHTWNWNKIIEDDRAGVPDGPGDMNEWGDNGGRDNEKQSVDWTDNDNGGIWDQHNDWTNNNDSGTWADKGNNDGGIDGAAPVPEPATMLLLGSGLVGLASYGRKKFKK